MSPLLRSSFARPRVRFGGLLGLLGLLLPACGSSDSSSDKGAASADPDAKAIEKDEPAEPTLDEVAAAHPVGKTDGCDAAALEAAAKTLHEQPAKAQAKLAATAITEACGGALDDAQKAWFKHLDRSERPFIPDLIAKIDTLATQSCPSLVDVRKKFGASAPDELAVATFNACGYEEHGVVEADRVTAFSGADPVAHSFFEWLTERGAPGLTAAQLVRGLLTFETHYGNPAVLGADGSLGKAKAVDPIPSCPIVRVSPRSIDLEHEKLVMVGEGMIDPSAVRGHLVGVLYDRLSSHPLKAEEDSTLCLAIDPSLTFEVVIDVMYTAGRTGYRHYGFIVESEDPARPFGSLGVDPPFFPRIGEPAKDAPFGPGVRVTPEGFSMELASEGFGPKRYEAIGSGLDYAALGTKLGEIHEEVPDATIVTFAVDEKLPVAALLKTLEAGIGAKFRPTIEAGT